MRSWNQRLLQDPITADFISSIADLAQAETRLFQESSAWTPPTAVEKTELDRWYLSAEGQETLVAAAAYLWRKLSTISAGAMPAHDARHAVFKVPAAAIEYVISEQVTGYERVGVLGALLHDQGRWAEERIFHGPWGGAIHARLSYLLAREDLSSFDMPAGVRNAILRAVAQHTKGANPEDPMPTKLTVTADRNQLYGPEIILRLVHQVPSQNEDLKALLESTSNSVTVTDRLLMFAFKKLPGPLFSRYTHVAWLENTLLDFLLMSMRKDLARTKFTTYQADWPSAFNFDEAWEAAEHQLPAMEGLDAFAVFQDFMDARHRAPADRYFQLAFEKLTTLRPHQVLRFLAALKWAKHQRDVEDCRQRIALFQAAQSFSAENDKFMAWLSRQVRAL